MPTVLQFPVLSTQFPFLSKYPDRQAVQAEDELLLQFIAPMHALFLRTVPNPHVMHFESSEGSNAKQAV